MQYVFQFILFQTKEQISWLLLLQKNYKELFYFDLWPLFLYMDVPKSNSGISRLQKNTFRLKGYTLFNILITEVKYE